MDTTLSKEKLKTYVKISKIPDEKYVNQIYTDINNSINEYRERIIKKIRNKNFIRKLKSDMENMAKKGKTSIKCDLIIIPCYEYNKYNLNYYNKYYNKTVLGTINPIKYQKKDIIKAFKKIIIDNYKLDIHKIESHSRFFSFGPLGWFDDLRLKDEHGIIIDIGTLVVADNKKNLWINNELIKHFGDIDFKLYAYNQGNKISISLTLKWS